MNRATHERDILSGRCGQGKWPKSQQVPSRNSEKNRCCMRKRQCITGFPLKIHGEEDTIVYSNELRVEMVSIRRNIARPFLRLVLINNNCFYCGSLSNSRCRSSPCNEIQLHTQSLKLCHTRRQSNAILSHISSLHLSPYKRPYMCNI